MRPLLLALLPALLSAAPALQIIRPIIAQMDGGAPDPPGFEHVAGETLFFSAASPATPRSEDEKVHLEYSVQAFDPKGVPLDEIYKNELKAEVSPAGQGVACRRSRPRSRFRRWSARRVQDSGQGRRRGRARPPPNCPSLSKSAATPSKPSDTLIVRNFQFFRDEEGTQPLERPSTSPATASGPSSTSSASSTARRTRSTSST